MRPKILTQLLTTSFKNKRQVLIKGKPGIGKTDIVKDAIAALDADLVLSHPSISDPTDYKGMPAIVADGTKAEFLPFGDLQRLIDATKLTVCFVDDIGQAPPAVQAGLMQLLHGRRINGHTLSEHVLFCGATNDTKHMAGVSGLLEPVKSRWHTIVELECDVQDWCEWALTHNMPPELIAFIRFRPKLLCDFKPTKELINSPCPRTVAAVGDWLNVGERSHEVIAGAAGDAFATEFVGFLSMYGELPSLDTILMDPDGALVPDKPAAVWAVTTGIASRATPQNFERVVRYLGRLPKEFEVCGFRDATARDSKLCHTMTGVHWMTNNAVHLS